MTRSKSNLTIAAAAVVLVFGCARQEGAASMAEPEPAAEPVAVEEPAAEAHATLAPREGLEVGGVVTFRETAAGVEIAAHLTGVARAGLHGLHIHAVGDCSAPDFTSAGGHFNPTDMAHGGPNDAERHAGDLGNIEIGEDGSGHLELTSSMLTVAEGPSTVVGRGVILHDGEDDLVSQPTGDAGSRLACGVVVEGPAGAAPGGDGGA